jgi:hypothetical protein
MSMQRSQWSDRDYFAPRREGSGRPLDPGNDHTALGWLEDGHVMHVFTTLPRHPTELLQRQPSLATNCWRYVTGNGTMEVVTTRGC